jgi:hypothetical protein
VEATWVNLEDFRNLYPSFQLEDELLAEGAGEMSWSADNIQEGDTQTRSLAGAAAAPADAASRLSLLSSVRRLCLFRHPVWISFS